MSVRQTYVWWLLRFITVLCILSMFLICIGGFSSAELGGQSTVTSYMFFAGVAAFLCAFPLAGLICLVHSS